MTDYQEEQNNEIEALQSIYPDECEVLRETSPRVVRVFISNNAEDEDAELYSFFLKVYLPEKYPDEPPSMETEEEEGFDADDLEKLMEILNQQVEENLGIVMIFTLTSAAQEWVTEFLENKANQEQLDKEEKLRQEHLAEIKRHEGTLVTLESFLAWRTKFDEERLSETKVTLKKNQKVKEERLTGRELFTLNTDMDVSDLQFLDDGDAEAVDESLFDDLDELDIEDEDEDDSDYVPES